MAAILYAYAINWLTGTTTAVAVVEGPTSHMTPLAGCFIPHQCLQNSVIPTGSDDRNTGSNEELEYCTSSFSPIASCVDNRALCSHHSLEPEPKKPLGIIPQGVGCMTNAPANVLLHLQVQRETLHTL